MISYNFSVFWPNMTNTMVISKQFWWHPRDRPWITKLSHDTTKSTYLIKMAQPGHTWISWCIQISKQDHDWQNSTMTFTKIHRDIKVYVMGLSDRVYCGSSSYHIVNQKEKRCLGFRVHDTRQITLDMTSSSFLCWNLSSNSNRTSWSSRQYLNDTALSVDH